MPHRTLGIDMIKKESTEAGDREIGVASMYNGQGA
jgi:hypothetical protein